MNMFLKLPLSLLAFVLPFVFADVEFTYPPAGAQIAADSGTINVQWKESGRSPPISALTQYTLDLMVGGDDVADMFNLVAFKAGGSFSNGNNVTNEIASNLCGPVPNGFFFRMQSTAASGGYVINFSSRFTLTGMTGSTDSKYREAAEKLNGDTSPPPREGNALPANASSSSAIPQSSTSPQTVTVTDGGIPADASGRPATTEPNNDGSSNHGVLVGVGVGVAAFIVVVVAFAVWIFMRRKRRQSRGDDWDDKDIWAVAAKKQPSVTTLAELSTEGRVVFVEAGDGLPPPEMDSNQIRAELPGDYFYEPSEMDTPIEIATPLTPIASSINGEETLPAFSLDKI